MPQGSSAVIPTNGLYLYLLPSCVSCNTGLCLSQDDMALREPIRITYSLSNPQKHLSDAAGFANHTLRTPRLALLQCACRLPNHTISSAQLALI